MAFCAKCGAQMQEDMRFCPQCGAPVHPGDRVRRGVPAGRNGFRAAAPAIAILLVVLAVWGLFLAFGGGDDELESPPAAPVQGQTCVQCGGTGSVPCAVCGGDGVIGN